MSRLWSFVKLSRPHFLVGGALMYGLGASYADAPFDLGRYLLGQAMVTAIQLTAHFVNEFADADRSVAERTFFSGGSGVLANGELAVGVALRAAFTTTALGLAGAS